MQNKTLKKFQISNLKSYNSKLRVISFKLRDFRLRGSRGYFLLEVLLAISIIAIIGFVSVVSINSFGTDQSLSKSSEMAVSIIAEARSKSVSSKDASKFGVHFETDKVVLFKGNSYSSSDSENVIYNIDSRSKILSVNLTGGVSDVVFNRFTGDTAVTGNIIFAKKSDTSEIKTVTIYPTGMAE